MKALGLILLPDEVLPLVLALAGICFIIGARQLAVGMITFVLASIFLPPLLAPMVEMVPLWILYLFLAYLVFLLPFLAVSLLQTLVTPALGRRTASDMSGHLAADMTKVLLLAPFRLLGLVGRLLTYLFRRP